MANILVVDSDESACEGIRKEFQKREDAYRHTIDGVTDYRAARGKLKNNNYDIVISDLEIGKGKTAQDLALDLGKKIEKRHASAFILHTKSHPDEIRRVAPILDELLRDRELRPFFRLQEKNEKDFYRVVNEAINMSGILRVLNYAFGREGGRERGRA